MIENEEVKASRSEKLLGLVVNDSLTWKNYLHGDEDNPGLLQNLSKRIGVLKILRKYLPDGKFRQAVSAIFTSKLIYCMSVWTEVWDIPGHQESSNKMGISKEDMRKLQILQNKTFRLHHFQNLSKRCLVIQTILQCTLFRKKPWLSFNR